MKNNAQLKSVRPPAIILPEARLKVIQGPYKGVSYKLVAAKIIIGREKTCDIQLTKDKKCSRQQAVVLFKNKSYYIKDLSGKASLKVNSVRKIQSELQDGDLIKCGTSILQFECKSLMKTPVSSKQQTPKVKVPIPLRPAGSMVPVASKPASANLQAPVPLSAQGALLTVQQDSPVHQSMPQPGLSPQAVSKKRSTGKKSQLPKILIGLLVVLFLFLLLDEDKKLKPQEDKLRTAESVEEDVKSLTELKEEEMEKRKEIWKLVLKMPKRLISKGLEITEKVYMFELLKLFVYVKLSILNMNYVEHIYRKRKIKSNNLYRHGCWMVMMPELKVDLKPA